MDYLSKIDQVVEKLIESNHDNLAEKIKDLKGSASTSSELLMSITFELLRAIEENDGIKKVIESETIELKGFCNSIGLNVK